MSSIRTAAAVAACLLAACGGPAEPPATSNPADLVIRGGKIVTMDGSGTEAEAMAVRGTEIVAVGATAEIDPMIGDTTRVIELDGAIAIPGLIEGHGHFLGTGFARMILDLREAQSWNEIVAMVETAAAKAEPGQWIQGRGWHQDKWSEVPDDAVEGVPVHTALSAVSPDNPVLLRHASGHGAIANAKAMELGGVDDATPDPEGGTIVRDAEGAATGYFRETAQGFVAGFEPTEADLRRAATLASEECLEKGITSFQDAGSSVEEVELLRAMAAEGELGVRLWMMIRDSNDDIVGALPAVKAEREAESHFTVGGIKHSIDGALGSHGAWMLEPYTDLPDTAGLNTVDIPTIEESARTALEHGLQLCVHAIGDRANRETLDIFERVASERGGDLEALRWRVEHAQHLDPADIPRFAELGVVASMQGVHCTSDGPWVPTRIGDERAEAGAYVWRTLLDSGAVVSNGTDVPVEAIDPIPNYYSTVTRMMGTGEPFYPNQKMTREEALRSMTLSAAYAAFEDDIKGSLELGKLADIVVLSRDVLEVPDDEILGTEVLYTIVGGEVRFER